VRRPVRLHHLPPSTFLPCTVLWCINDIYWLCCFRFLYHRIFQITVFTFSCTPSIAVCIAIWNSIGLELSLSATMRSCSLFLLCLVSCFLLQNRTLTFASFKSTGPRLPHRPFSLCGSKNSRSSCIFIKCNASACVTSNKSSRTDVNSYSLCCYVCCSLGRSFLQTLPLVVLLFNFVDYVVLLLWMRDFCQKWLQHSPEMFCSALYVNCQQVSCLCLLDIAGIWHRWSHLLLHRLLSKFGISALLSADPLATGLAPPFDYSFGQLLQLNAALINTLVPWA
jgi:hypothetical protein